MSLNEMLEKLSNACGVTGREEQVRQLLTKYLTPYVNEITVDRLDNVIAVKKGKKDAPKIMLAAHMDEVGLMVKTISKEGYLQFTKIGGIDDRILPAQKVLVHGKKGALPGIVGSKPPHIQKEDERKKIINYDEMFIDVGAVSRENVAEMGITIGNPVSFDIKYQNLGNDMVAGKAFDNRSGCVVMVEAMKLLQKSDCTIYAVGTVQEEVGLRGATTAAFSIEPDVGLALDVTVAGDVPGVKEFDTSVKLGKGPALSVSDSGLITHPKVLQWLMDTAEKEKIAFQLESGLLGSTDAARISLTRSGVPAGVISVPARYIHSPVGMVNLKDLENCAKLAAAAIQNIAKRFQM
jgi:tetrahedral aminopeptidase